jgi:CheY-like chemotaxis protein
MDIMMPEMDGYETIRRSANTGFSATHYRCDSQDHKAIEKSASGSAELSGEAR